MSKSIYVKTWGCQMNVYDSGRMIDVLAPLGYRPTEDPAEADILMLNTCHIREKATEKVFSELGRLRAIKQERERRGLETIIGVAGCVAQAEGALVAERASFVDIVVGPQAYHELPEMVGRARRRSGGAEIATDFDVEAKFDRLPEERQAPGPAAFLSIQEGCDRFCTFCVVPYTRGAEYSRPVQPVLDEARRLVDMGTREITLLGQNVNAYHGTGPDGTSWRLGRLITALAEIDGLDRLRYTTSHPRDMDDELIEAHGAVPALMPFLHLPVQSGADRILKAMNRRHKAEDYLRLVERLRRARPDLALSSDFIVGFPGESAEDFAATLGLVREVGFAQAYSFKYSPRPGTPAADRNDQLDEQVKKDRLAELQALLDGQQQAFNAGFVGGALPVLFDRPGRRSGQLLGRSPYLQAVHVEAPAELMGTLAEVTITAVHPNSLAGALAHTARAGRAIAGERAA